MLRIDQLRIPGLNPVSFSLPAGECIALMGPSGCGKTRLLRAIADLDQVQGMLFLEGAERSELPGPVWRRSVSYVAAESGWWAPTVAAHFELAGDMRARCERLLDSLGLVSDILDTPVSRASTGERQRLALARTLLNEPKVLLLDEPTGALDPTSAALVEEVLRYQLLLSRAIVLVTHDLAQAQRLARKLIRLEGGEAVFYEFATPARAPLRQVPGATA